MNDTENQPQNRQSSYNLVNGVIDKEPLTEYMNNPQISKAGRFNRYRQEVSNENLHLE